MDFHNNRFARQAWWLIELRWLAIGAIIVALLIARNFFGIAIRYSPFIYIFAALLLHNLTAYCFLKRILNSNAANTFGQVKRLIDFQIILDLLSLITLLHFSGGIENPVIIFFVFHMIIASILLSVRESYIHATIAVILFVSLGFLEHWQILPHYCLEGFIECDIHNRLYILGSSIVFAVTMYLVVYMTGSVSTQLRKQEHAYMQANIELKQKDRIKDEYVLRVTHDIKSHLAAVQSCLGVVADKFVGSLNEQQNHFIGRAYERTNMLVNFVRMLLKLTTMRLNGELEMEPCDLISAISNSVNMVKSKADDKSIELTQLVEPGKYRITANQFSIEEAISNLLLNAIKYTSEGGRVEVNAADNGDSTIIEIVDTGIGIPQQEIGRVFDEFYRANNARQVETDGTGLGLSIVKQIIEAHGGRIWVESCQNQGTKFSFSLPKVITK